MKSVIEQLGRCNDLSWHFEEMQRLNCSITVFIGEPKCLFGLLFRFWRPADCESPPTRKSRGHPFFWKRIFTQFCLNSLANIIFLKFRFDKINTQRPHLVPISLEYVSIIFFWLPYRLYFLPLLLILKVLVNRIWTSDQRDTDARTSTFDKGVHMDVCDNVEQYLDPKIEYSCTLMSVACTAGTLKSQNHVNMLLLGCHRLRLPRLT